MRADDTEVWFGSVEFRHGVVEALAACLSAGERERSRHFVFERDRRQYSVCRAILRKILGVCLNADPAQLRIGYNRYGKPELEGSHLSFNVSHTDGMAAVAVAWCRKVGIDIEKMHRHRPVLRLSERYFCPREIEKMRMLERKKQCGAFYVCWTRKEAYLKALGRGMCVPLPSFEVTLLPGEPVCLVEAGKMDVNGWELMDLDIGADYAGAIAVEGHGWRLRTGVWDERGVPNEPGVSNLV